METFHLEVGESSLIPLKDVPPDTVSSRDNWNPGLSSDSTLSWKENTNIVILATNLKVVGDFFSLKLSFLRVKMALLRPLHSPISLIGI